MPGPYYNEDMSKAFRLFGPFCVLFAVPLFGQEPLATVDGEAILEADLPISSEQRKLDQQMYELRAKALGGTISTMLLNREADKRGVDVEELVQVEITPKVGVPTNKEISDFYNAQKDKIAKPLKEVRDQIAGILQQEKFRMHFAEFIAALRADSEVKIHLDPPRLPVNLEDARLRGPQDAPVTIVEFSDFQCPFCRSVQATLTELREQYEDRVRWAFKDLPLTEIHPEALRAAQAARCAGEQGKFWEFRAKLFEQELFTDAMYTEVATELKLKADPLLECVNSGKYEGPVTAEAREASGLGIEGTPAILINGILMTGARPLDTYQRIIDRELELTANP